MTGEMKLMAPEERHLLRERFRRHPSMRTLPKMHAAPSMAARFIADAPIDPESPLPFVLVRLLDLEDEVERLRAALELLAQPTAPARSAGWLCGAFQQPSGDALRPYRCTEPYGHRGAHLAIVDGRVAAEWPRKQATREGGTDG